MKGAYINSIDPDLEMQNVASNQCVHYIRKFLCILKYFVIYTQQQKKRENLLLLNWVKIKYFEFKKYILPVKLTLYYTVSFTCNIHFLKSTYFIFSQFKSDMIVFLLLLGILYCSLIVILSIYMLLN